MKSKKFLKIATTAMGLTFAAGAVVGMLTACGDGGGGGGTTGGANKPLVLSTDPLDGVFNPFFYTAGADGEVVGQTMISMLSTDKNGQIVAGEDEPCVALDYSVITTGTSDDRGTPGASDEYAHYYTDYYFAVKDNIKFSDGVALTIKDVLFNIYMYLDPAYTGSATMYSVDIQGLGAYRTQQTDIYQQEGFQNQLNLDAQKRIDALRDWADDKNSTYNDLSDVEKGDLAKVDEYFKEELASDWNNAMAADLKEYDKYVDKSGNKIFTENWQVFLYNYGVIKLTTEKDPTDSTKKWYTVDNQFNTATEKTQEALTGYVFTFMLGAKTSASDTYKQNLVDVITYYATANSLRQYLIGEALKEELGGQMNVRTVSGITVEHGSTIPGEDGQPKQLGKELDILHIRINGEDPKAIQNFGFTVAPLHYYSSHASEFNLTQGQEYFGVEYGDSDFMNEVRYNQVPLGAGPYRASTENGSNPTDKIEKSNFYSDNIVYLESNENFFLGAPKIKKLRFKVISTSLLYEAVKTGEVNYASPTAKAEMLTNLDGADRNTLGYTITENLGYGYIGINATYVHDILIRRAIMHAMDTGLCIDYYGEGELASAIYRPMSKVIDWCYPSEITQPYYKYDPTGKTSLDLAHEAGYDTDPNGSGFLVNSKGERLKFTFTIAGDSEDHPAYATMQNAAEILNKIGFDVTVTRDSTALSKLSAGRLEVWAAAWSSSSDPDMYQVYHKDSSATSILAWGFPWMESSEGSDEERELLEELAAKIEEGRETTDRAKRRKSYSVTEGDDKCALDLVMELAVELPTYQRKAIYVYQKDLFDEESLNKYFGSNATAFQSPLARIWEIGFRA